MRSSESWSGAVEPSIRHFDKDLFISYSRMDDAIVRRLTGRLSRYRPPRSRWLQLRREPRLKIYRDIEERCRESLSELEAALASSSKLLVACSPAARASEYVAREIRTFARLRPDGRIIPVLVGGLANKEAARKGRLPEAAFPDALLEVINGEPGPPRFLTPKAISRFRGQRHEWNHLLATIYDTDRSTIERRELKRVLSRLSTVVLLSLAFLLAFLVPFVANRTNTSAHLRDAAENASRLAEKGSPDISILVSAFVLEHATDETTKSIARSNILEASTRAFWQQAVQLRDDDSIAGQIEELQWANDETILAVAGSRAWILDARKLAPSPTARLKGISAAHLPRFSELIADIGTDHSVTVMNLTSGKHSRLLLPEKEERASSGLLSCGTESDWSLFARWRVHGKDVLLRWRHDALSRQPEILWRKHTFWIDAFDVSHDCTNAIMVGQDKLWLTQLLTDRGTLTAPLVPQEPAVSPSQNESTESEPDRSPSQVSLSPDGQRLALVRMDYRGYSDLTVWTIGRQLRKEIDITDVRTRINDIAWSPDSRHIASVHSNGEIVVWSATGGRGNYLQEAGAMSVDAVAWNPTGHSVVTGAAPRHVKIWPLRRSVEAYALNGVPISPESRREPLAGGRDIVRLVYRDGKIVSDFDIVKTARSHVGRPLVGLDCAYLPKWADCR